MTHQWEGLNPPYGTIVVDPPWHYEQVNPNKSREGYKGSGLAYSSMSLDEIKALPVAELVGPKGGFLWLWTTNRYLRDAFDVMAAWGFSYRQTLVWVKGDASPFPGAVAPNTAEYVLVGRSGSLRRLGTAPASVLEANRGAHSAKPQAFMDLIEAVSPTPRVELFCRRPRLGWDHWGHGYELGAAS